MDEILFKLEMTFFPQEIKVIPGPQLKYFINYCGNTFYYEIVLTR